jgi:hypothetical protein
MSTAETYFLDMAPILAGICLMYLIRIIKLGHVKIVISTPEQDYDGEYIELKDCAFGEERMYSKEERISDETDKFMITSGIRPSVYSEFKKRGFENFGIFDVYNRKQLLECRTKSLTLRVLGEQVQSIHGVLIFFGRRGGMLLYYFYLQKVEVL